MLASRLTHRVKFEQQVSTQDPVTGDVEISWSPVTFSNGVEINMPAEVFTGPGREYAASGSIYADTAVRIQMRWFPGLDHSWRVLWEGKYFDIQSIETDSTARREYRLRCTSGPSKGL